jgi:hypothetical protein
MEAFTNVSNQLTDMGEDDEDPATTIPPIPSTALALLDPRRVLSKRIRVPDLVEFVHLTEDEAPSEGF